jgi:hypothetical protein
MAEVDGKPAALPTISQQTCCRSFGRSNWVASATMLLPANSMSATSRLRAAGTHFRSFRCSRSMRTQEPELNAMRCKYQARNRL